MKDPRNQEKPSLEEEASFLSPHNEIWLTGDGSASEKVHAGGWACAMEIFRNGEVVDEDSCSGGFEEGATSMKMEIFTLSEGIEMIPRPFPTGMSLKIKTDQEYVAEMGNEILESKLEEWRDKNKERANFKEYDILATKLKKLQEEGAPIEIEYMPPEERTPTHGKMDRESYHEMKKASKRKRKRTSDPSKDKGPEGPGF